jgi:hypothetical protein
VPCCAGCQLVALQKHDIAGALAELGKMVGDLLGAILMMQSRQDLCSVEQCLLKSR